MSKFTYLPTAHETTVYVVGGIAFLIPLGTRLIHFLTMNEPWDTYVQQEASNQKRFFSLNFPDFDYFKNI